MSIYEISLALTVTSVVILSIFSRRVNTGYIRFLALMGLFLMLVHFLTDSPRWPMLPFYLTGLLSPFLILVKVHRVLKAVTNSLTTLVLFFSALVCALVPFDPTLNLENSSYNKGRRISNALQFSQAVTQRENNEIQQSVVLFSKSHDHNSNDYFEAINRLIEKGYTVMSISPSCPDHNSNGGFLIKKADNPERQPIIKSQQSTPEMQMHYATYSPE